MTSRRPLRTAALAGTLALAGPAMAQNQSMTVYGVLDAGLYVKQLAGQTRTKGLDSGLMDTSNLGFRGSEDLGGGWRALFDLSAFLQTDTGAATRGIPGESFWSRAALVGVTGPYGTVRLGRISTPGFIGMIRFNPFGASPSLAPAFMHTYVGSAAQPMATGSGATDSTWSNSIAWTSPRWGDVTVALQAAPSEGGSGGRRFGGSLSYGGSGPFAAVLAFDDVSDAALASPVSLTTLPGALPPLTARDFRTLQLGASYDLKSFKLFGQWFDTEIDGSRPTVTGTTTLTLRTLQAGVSVPLSGNGTVLLSMARSDKSLTGSADATRTTTALGYTHLLSKRTDLYGVLLLDRLKATDGGTGYAAGIRHRF